MLRPAISDKKAVQTLVDIDKWEFILLLIIQIYISDKHSTAKLKVKAHIPYSGSSSQVLLVSPVIIIYLQSLTCVHTDGLF